MEIIKNIVKPIEVTGTAVKYAAVKGKAYKMIETKDGFVPRDPTYPLGSPGLIARTEAKPGTIIKTGVEVTPGPTGTHISEGE